MTSFEVPLVRIRMGGSVGFADKPKEPPPPRPIKIPQAAKDLALGHRIVRAVESGEVRDYSEAARRLGVSQARVSQLVAITFLVPDLQKEVLAAQGTLKYLNIHHLLLASRIPPWEQQRILLRPT